MRSLSIIFALFFTHYCSGQCDENIKFDSTIFNQPLQKKVDTIYFKATYETMGKIPQVSSIQKLNAKGYINKKNYKTAVFFTPIGSFTGYYLPYKDTDPNVIRLLFLRQKQNQSICIRGIVIKGFEKYNSKPFFLLDKIWFENH